MTHAVELERSIAEGIPAVFVDRGAMVEVLLHLLHNAHRYTGDEKRIRVRCERGAHADTVAICVEDNGPGIAKCEQLRIFDKFYRGEDPLKRDLAGTGLGLAIVKHIVRGNGGTVSVESDIGKGSSFRILLPAAA
jgi:signal transduction histidine kinase